MKRPATTPLCLALGLATVAAFATAGEARAIHETRPLDASGSVEIINVAGSVAVQGWDQPQLEVSGTLGDQVERVEIDTSGNRATVRVVLPASVRMGGDGSADLTVHMPRHGTLSVTLVSADLRVQGIAGDAQLRTVSGDINGDLEGDAHVNTVSGDVRLKLAGAKETEVKAISGDVNLYGPGGSVSVSTVSGDAELSLGTLTRGRFQSVSGDLGIGSALSADGQIDAESVSGDIMLSFSAAPDAAIDLQSFSGDIDSCFGPKPVESEYGPGSRLQFTAGSGAGRLRVATKSGAIRLCTKSAKAPPR
jgi:hypothetical protein